MGLPASEGRRFDTPPQVWIRGRQFIAWRRWSESADNGMSLSDSDLDLRRTANPSQTPTGGEHGSTER